MNSKVEKEDTERFQNLNFEELEKTNAKPR